MMNKKIHRMLAALMAAALAISLCPWALADVKADTRNALKEDYTGKTVILHSNDVHGEIMGYAYIAGLRSEFEARGASVILADAGDFSQGDPTVSLSKGADAIDMMNAAHYDVATLGNHEFDFGYEQLKDNLSKADFPVICADVYEGDDTILGPTWEHEGESGLTIGFFGMETPETQTKVNPGLIQGIRFVSNMGTDKTALYTCAQEQIDTLRQNGVDIVIALAHLGVDDESAPDGHRSVDLYNHTQGIDLILDGHSHTVMTEGENGEPVQSTGTKFAYVGVVVIDNASKKIEDHYLMPTKVTETVTEKDPDTGEDKEVENVIYEMAKDETVAAKAQAIIDRVDKEYGAVFAKSEVLLNGERSPGNRTEETNLGDLITDAIVWKVLKEDGALTVDDEHVVGITNGGGIRASIQVGDVTRKDLNTVLPFGNTVSVVYVTGAELLEALEASTYATPEALGGYPQTTGIEFTLVTTRPYDQGDAYPESTYYSPASIQRVTITAINGEPFDPEATYAVVTNNFCAAGGDTYYVFKNASAQFDTGIVMDEAVMEYVDDVLAGVISKETYDVPRGDQTIITELSGDPHAATVTGGSGSGDYREREPVRVAAEDPEEGKEFDKWTWTGSENLTFLNNGQYLPNATFIMPGTDVQLTATFRNVSSTPTATPQGCYVATAVYGSYDCPEVWTLRRFRDKVLAKTWYGRLFIHLYYAISPTAVRLFGNTALFQNFFRGVLDPWVANLQADGFESTPYQDRAW